MGQKLRFNLRRLSRVQIYGIFEKCPTLKIDALSLSVHRDRL